MKYNNNQLTYKELCIREDVTYNIGRIAECQLDCEHRLVEEKPLFSTVEKWCDICGKKL